MYIDDCRHTFQQLASTVLPQHLNSLRQAIATPWPAAAFTKPRVGPASIAAALKLGGDFSGCYVFIAAGAPFYVGISRSVLCRIRQHLLGATHFDASLAYAMAKRRTQAQGTRSALMRQRRFRNAFAAAQEELSSSSVAAIEVTNSVELYLFELFAAMELRTHEWNTFRTH